MLHNQVEREANLLSLLAACLKLFLIWTNERLVTQEKNNPNAAGSDHC